MTWLTLIQPVAYAFGFFAFGALFALAVKESFRRVPTERDRVYVAVFFASSAWFALNLIRTLRASPPDFILLLAPGFFFPPLLMHLFALDRDDSGIGPNSKRWLYAGYAVSGVLAAFTLCVRFGWIELPRPEVALGSALVGFIGVASGFCLAAVGRGGLRVWNVALFMAVIALVIAG
ncbi:MAG: hypothetical protein ACRD8O_16275, partial [Bryobacteraceae bacterium]